MRTIMIPLDGSTFAEQALAPAQRIARRTRARLELVAVHEPAVSSHRARAASPNEQRLHARLGDELRDYLMGLTTNLCAADESTPVEARVLEGPVVETLARHAATTAPDLIVLTTHARGGPSRAWLGSVAEGLLRTTTTPVLAVRPSGTVPAAPVLARTPRVIIALDGTPDAEVAIDGALAVAGTTDAEYVFVRVVAPLHPLLHAVGTEQAFENDLARQRREAEVYLEAVAERVRVRGARVRTEVRVDANAAKAIVEYAAEGGDLIAMATHARGPIGRALLGSVADKVLRTASTPVLLFRASEEVGVPERPPAAARAAEPTTEHRAPPAAAPLARSVAMTRVLVATDLAEPSRRAAAWAARHFPRDVDFVIVNAITIPRLPPFFGQSAAARDELCASARRGADARIRELTLSLGVDRVWPEVRCGPAADVVVAAATEYGADLIVAADRGARGGVARLLGGTVERILRATHTPLLLARNLPDAPPRRILVAVDDSPELPHVLAWTWLLAAHFRANVVALYAVDPTASRAVQLGTPGVDPQRVRQRMDEAVGRWLQDQVAALGTDGFTVTPTVAFGDPGPEILAAAKRTAADLIVIGRGGAGRALAAIVGGVADHVLRIGDGPVLVVPAPAAQTAAS